MATWISKSWIESLQYWWRMGTIITAVCVIHETGRFGKEKKKIMMRISLPQNSTTSYSNHTKSGTVRKPVSRAFTWWYFWHQIRTLKNFHWLYFRFDRDIQAATTHSFLR